MKKKSKWTREYRIKYSKEKNRIYRALKKRMDKEAIELLNMG